MSLKSLIQRLLDSRTTPAQAANASIPLYSKTSQHVQETKTEEDFSAVAPFDCFVTANVNSAQTSTSRLCSYGIKVNGVHISWTNTYFPTGSVWFDKGAFVKKGDLVTVSFNPWNVTTIETQFTIFFHKLIGGGYNNLVRRALSCLRALSNFSLKNSLLAEATGFPTNPIQLFKRRISHLQRQENGFLSSLLATGGSASKGLPRKFCLATGRFGRGAIQQRHLIKAFVFLSQKAGLWPTYYRQTPRAHMSSLFRVSAINSFQTGGALC